MWTLYDFSQFCRKNNNRQKTRVLEAEYTYNHVLRAGLLNISALLTFTSLAKCHSDSAINSVSITQNGKS